MRFQQLLLIILSFHRGLLRGDEITSQEVLELKPALEIDGLGDLKGWNGPDFVGTDFSDCLKGFHRVEAVVYIL